MKCNECKEALSAYYDKELDQEQIVAITAHLEECETCKKAYEEFREIFDCLKEDKEVTMPPLLHKKMMEKVTKEARKEKVIKLWPSRVGGMVAALVVGIILVKTNPLDFRSSISGDYETTTEEIVMDHATTNENVTKARAVPSVHDVPKEAGVVQSEGVAQKDANKDAYVEGHEEQGTVEQDFNESTIKDTLQNNIEEETDKNKALAMQVWEIETNDMAALTQYLTAYEQNNNIQMKTLQEGETSFILYGITDSTPLFEALQTQEFIKSIITIEKVGENIKIVVKP